MREFFSFLELEKGQAESHDEGDEDGRGGVGEQQGRVRTRAIVVTVAGRRANGHHGLEEDDVTLGLAEDVDGLARVVGILLLLDRNHAEDRIRVLVVEGKVADAVMLIVFYLDVVTKPEMNCQINIGNR